MATNTDSGTLLEEDEFCAIWSPTEGYSFMAPKSQESKELVPDEAAALMAAVIRLDTEPEFRQELLKWFLGKKH